jgi:hypothetical protein
MVAVRWWQCVGGFKIVHRAVVAHSGWTCSRETSLCPLVQLLHRPVWVHWLVGHWSLVGQPVVLCCVAGFAVWELFSRAPAFKHLHYGKRS